MNMTVARHGNDAQGVNTQERMVKNEYRLVSSNYEWNNYRASIIDTCESEVEE